MLINQKQNAFLYLLFLRLFTNNFLKVFPQKCSEKNVKKCFHLNTRKVLHNFGYIIKAAAKCAQQFH